MLLVTAAPYPRIGARAPSLQSVFNFRLVSGTPLAKSRAKILMQGGAHAELPGVSSSMENSSSCSPDPRGRDGDGAVPERAVAVVEQAECHDEWKKNSFSLGRGGERQAGISWPILITEYTYLGKMPPPVPSDGDPLVCWG